MLTLGDLQEFAKRHELQLSVRHGRSSGQDQAVEASIWFTKERPDAWRQLLTTLTEVPITIYGTRQMTGSGATDDRLFPCYAALLDQVNAERRAIGLGRVWA